MQEIITQGLGYGFVDLDETIQEAIDESSVQLPNGDRFQNNMFVFHIYNVMAKDPRITIHLEKRRQVSCPNCTDIMAMSKPSQDSASTSRPRSLQRQRTVSDWNFSKTLEKYQHCSNPSLG